VCVNKLREYHFKAWRSVTPKEHFNIDEICRHEAANLCKSGKPFLQGELHLLKNCYNMTVFLKKSSPMDEILLDCCFNAVYEGLKFRKSTLRYAT
jgi:hypothetical protein